MGGKRAKLGSTMFGWQLGLPSVPQLCQMVYEVPADAVVRNEHNEGRVVQHVGVCHTPDVVVVEHHRQRTKGKTVVKRATNVPVARGLGSHPWHKVTQPECNAKNASVPKSSSTNIQTLGFSEKTLHT